MGTYRNAPLPSGTHAVSDVLQQDSAWQSLGERLRASRARLQAVLPLMPVPMRAHVQAGPIDEAQWVLLTDSQAVAAKLRQMLPTLQARLDQQALGLPPIKVRTLASTRPR